MNERSHIRVLHSSTSVTTNLDDGVQIIIVYSGRVYARTSKERQIIPGPSTLFINIGMPYQLRTDTNTRGYVVEVSASMLARICRICSSVVPENMASTDVSFRTVPLPNQLKNRIKTMIDGFSEKNIAEVDEDIEMLTTAQIVVLLHPLVAQDAGHATPGKAPRKTDITAYIEAHYTEQFTLSSLAERYNLNPSYFARSFKRDHGQTVFEYLHGLRISAACTLLKRSNKPVLEIAIEVGYNNISFFNRCFRRITGTTPVEYRRS